MGSMLKFESERRDLVRERRNARIERKQQRRQARERKHSQTTGVTPEPASVMHRLAEREMDAAVDRIVDDVLDRHEQPARVTALAGEDRPAPGGPQPQPAQAQPAPVVAGAARAPRQSQRDRDLAAYRDRREQILAEARSEARRRIGRAGELASVADAFAALEHVEAGAWSAERRHLETAVATGRIADIGAAARRALWAISRDAARTTRRARRDPDLALAVCVAYAIIARLPRTALRSAQRARPTPHVRSGRRRAFWR